MPAGQQREERGQREKKIKISIIFNLQFALFLQEEAIFAMRADDCNFEGDSPNPAIHVWSQRLGVQEQILSEVHGIGLERNSLRGCVARVCAERGVTYICDLVIYRSLIDYTSGNHSP